MVDHTGTRARPADPGPGLALDPGLGPELALVPGVGLVA